MARGFDSKSVEDQISDGQHQKETDAKKHHDARVSATVSRERQSLELQREFILSQRTSSPHRRSALESALSDVEAKLAALPG